MVSQNILHVGNTNLNPSLIDPPTFMSIKIDDFEDSLRYSETELRDIYVAELDRICSLFNQAILPRIIDNVIFNLRVRYISNPALMDELHSMKQSGDYSSFAVKTDFFDIKYSTGSRVMGTFTSYRVNYLNMCDVFDIEDLIDRLGQRGRMGININIHYMRGHFFNYMFDTLRHEMAHALVHIYYDGLLKALTDRVFDIKPHGKEWKSMASLLGANPKATAHVGHDKKAEVQKSMEYYNRNQVLVDGKKMTTRKKARYHYHCGCTDHWITANKHNKIIRGAGYSCRKCHQRLSFMNRKKYVY
jgi:predicted SprT family Zn-dependent metalloprotease